MQNARAQFERFLLSPAHPFLLSIYFVLRVFAENASDVPVLYLFRPLLLSVLGAGLFFWLFLRWTRMSHSAALMTSILVLAFYTYGVAWVVLAPRLSLSPDGFAVLWAVATILAIVLLGWKMRATPSADLIAGMNLMAIILLFFPIIQLADLVIWKSRFPPPNVSHVFQGTLPDSPPDIYFMILDSHGRADVLQDDYGYDSSAFVQSLSDLGFYVAECSQSNYASTALSLTSIFNLDYLQNLSDTFQPGRTELLGLYKYLDNNAVQESLSRMGYKTVAFASGFPWAEWRDADMFIAPRDGPMTEFETLLLQSTTYATILDRAGILDFEEKYAQRFRTRTRLVLGSFDELAAMPGPKFVFIHLISPHPPFAFDENGNPVSMIWANPQDGYLEQVKFIDRFLLPGLKTLVEKSARPPVIMIQGDHGPLRRDDPLAEIRILNAYHLPKGSESLYPTITPVNSFRIVFNAYFGTSFPLLPDVTYYSSRSHRYDFSVAQNTCTK